MAKRRVRAESKISTVSDPLCPEGVRFALTSDTHYGFNHKTHTIHENFLAALKEAIETYSIKAVLHAGDWSSYRQDQFYRTMKMFRKYIPSDIPILCVRGNHDFWDHVDGCKVRSRRMWGELVNMHKEWFKEHNVHHLEEGPHVVDDVIVCGFDGWYNRADPPTNDSDRMIGNIEGCPAMVYHSSRAYKELCRVLDTDTDSYRKSICVSHFPPFGGDRKGLTERDMSYSANPRYLEPITEKFDVFCVGHSHMHVDRIENGCRLLNAGSDYNSPRFVIFDV